MATLPVVRDYMDDHVHTLPPDMDMRAAVRFLLENRVTGAPVVDEEGTLLGIVTEKDCLRLLTHGVDNDVPRGVVADFMTTEVISIPPTMDVYYAAGIFTANHFRRLPVVLDGRLVGAITRYDLLRVIDKRL